MQRRTTRQLGDERATSRSTDRCPACGRAIEGIEATGSGHRFVGCGHSASTLPLPSAGDAPSFAGITIE
jgi:hypothetical protein